MRRRVGPTFLIALLAGCGGSGHGSGGPAAAPTTVPGVGEVTTAPDGVQEITLQTQDDYVFTPEPVAKADFFVNVPKLKAHPWTTVTFGNKNYIGIQDDRHRLIDHDHSLNEKIADLQYIIQPQLLVIDAITAGERAYGALHGMLLAQASMVAFVWLFRLLGGIFLMLLPLILIMRRPKGRAAAQAAH